MSERLVFEYGEREVSHLKARDPILAKAMDAIGHIDRAVIPDMFVALVNAIVGQQISTKALGTVWERVQTRFAPLTPKRVASIAAEELQTCGMTMRKAGYIKEIANAVADGGLDLSRLREMTDGEVCERLVRLKGIGAWTAEMLMTFSMQRMDVMSWDDLAIHRGLRMLYGHRKITPALFAKYRRRYSPYATVASLYLWAIAGGACSGLSDPAPKTGAQKKALARKRAQAKG